MARVYFLPTARAELDDALKWYETYAAHMTPQFHAALGAVVARIEANPLQFPPTGHGARRAALKRFPYLVIFRESDDAAYVVAVFHTSRNPRSLAGR